MSGPALLAIDAGGTAVKVAAFDAEGAELARATADVRTEHHLDGRVERDPEIFWRGTAQAIRSVTAKLGGRVPCAVGCTGFGNGIFLVDAAGRGTRPGIVSVDHRAQPIVEALEAEGAAEAIAAATGHRLWGGQTLMQIAHLARNEPAVMARTRWALACKDFVRFRLTGAAFTDPTDASGGGLMALGQGGYAAEVFEALGLPEVMDRLPPIAGSGAVAGRVSATAAAETGLAEGTPVAGSMMDVAACALGAGAGGRAAVTMIAGTWSINTIESATPPRGTRMPLLNMLYGAGGRRLVAEGSPSSAAHLGWYLDRILGGTVTPDEAGRIVAASPVRARRCHFLPYVFGPVPLTGGFVGLGAGDDRGSMLRAIFEAVAFRHRGEAEVVARYLDRALPPVIRLAGGAARSQPWAQVFADVCQRPVEVARADEVGALGAAICAAVAGGLYGDLEEAAAAMTGVARVHAPDPALGDFYAERIEEFQRLDRGMAGLLAGREG